MVEEAADQSLHFKPGLLRGNPPAHTRWNWLGGCDADGETLTPANHQSSVIIVTSEVRLLVALDVQVYLLDLQLIKWNYKVFRGSVNNINLELWTVLLIHYSTSQSNFKLVVPPSGFGIWFLIYSTALNVF